MQSAEIYQECLSKNEATKKEPLYSMYHILDSAHLMYGSSSTLRYISFSKNEKNYIWRWNQKNIFIPFESVNEAYCMQTSKKYSNERQFLKPYDLLTGGTISIGVYV